jgi:hypothetical protein
MFVNTIVCWLHQGETTVRELSNANADLSTVTVQYYTTTSPFYCIITFPYSLIGSYPKITVISNIYFEDYFEGRT